MWSSATPETVLVVGVLFGALIGEVNDAGAESEESEEESATMRLFWGLSLFSKEEPKSGNELTLGQDSPMQTTTLLGRRRG